MKQFIALYDKAPIFSLNGMNIFEQYQALGIEDKMSHTTSRVEDVLKGRILDPITAKGEPKIARMEVEKLKNVFTYCKILEHTDRYESYYIALNCIFSIGGNNIEDYVPLSEEKQWMEALSYLKGYIELHPQNDPFRDDFRQKELDRARAAVRLSKIGLRVEIENNNLKFDKEYMVTSQLSNWISQIGGVRFVEALLSLLPYDQRKGRLMLVRQGNLPNPGAFVPEYPFGYLLNLGLRHTSSIGSEEALKKHFGHVMNLSRDFCLAVYPYQSYSIWEKVFHRNETVLEYFQRLTLMDCLYYMQQRPIRRNVPRRKPIRKNKAFVPERLSNGDTEPELLARCRYSMMVSGDKWTATQKERMKLVFERYPDLEEAYSLVHSLRMIFSNPRATWISGYESIQKWYEKVKAFGNDAFNTAADTIRDREDEVLNYFINRATNASAESLNSKIKQFRAQLRGVIDVDFFLYRLSMIYG